MDKIFQEIKKAIEEEMRNAEGGPPPGGGRAQGGGRRAQEYADWLKEEQERLRGGGQAPSQPEPLREVPVEAPPDEEWVPVRERQQQRERQSREQRQQRQDVRDGQQRRDRQAARSQQGQPRQDRQQRARPQQRQTRHDRRTSSAYELRTASQMGGQIERLLRSPNGLRQAFLLREIISKPVSLRDPDDHLIT